MSCGAEKKTDTLTYHDALKAAQGVLEEKGIEAAGNDAWILLEHVSGLDRGGYILHAADPMSSAQQKEYFDLVRQRGQHIPLQHITGTAWFMGLPFRVNQDVLIPRQDTETVVLEGIRFLEERAYRGSVRSSAGPEASSQDRAGLHEGTGLCEGTGLHEEAGQHPARVLDLCTGSGCIIISLKQHFPDLICTASDISEKALAAAKQNADLLGQQIELIRGDLFEHIQGTYDLIISNPPYIETSELESLMDEVRLYDPRRALDGGEDGLVFYRRIARESPHFLKSGGALVLEIGCFQAADVGSLLQNDFTDIRVLQDLSGLDRVVSARRK